MKKKGIEMNHCKLLRWGAWLVIGLFALNVSAAASYETAYNRVTESVFQDHFALGQDENGDNLTKSVFLSQLDLNEVARREGVGTAANYVLSSVVLSMNGVVYGSIYFKNNSASPVTPSFKVAGQSMLTFGSDVTPYESYSRTTPIGTIAAGGEYNDAAVNIVGSATPKTMTITEGLDRFLGTGTIETIGAFPVDGYFSSGGTAFDSTVALQGKADIAVTYNYDYITVPEPTSMVLVMLGGAVLALHRKSPSGLTGNKRLYE